MKDMILIEAINFNGNMFQITIWDLVSVIILLL